MATTVAHHITPSPFTQVKVNVRLCGSIPRTEMENAYIKQQQHTQQRLETSSSSDSIAQQLCSQLSSFQQQRQFEQQQPPTSRTATFEPPSWAVPASGEARLEPVCDSVDRQGPVDLTSQAVFRVGRAPQSDVHLKHVTSSRRHAMLFHHTNGSCYLVDCGSAHGTYINGVRVTSAPNDGVVVPHKVRRGSLIRFGGPGAPTFVLKSFAFALDELSECPKSAHPTLMPSTPTTLAVVEHNTRFNALGKTAKQAVLMQLSSKRSFDSLETIAPEEMMDFERCSSPPLSPEKVPLRLVSPDLLTQQTSNKRRRVTFSDAPPMASYPILVSPDVSSDEHETDICE
ncbi:FHA domain containing protein [Nitzschia inconspicua]|uniref:FHA domain containing protein n=1 Tax=Nitzschia inconspicua TaxID=303405 RepID=A0A9K3PDH7_9STRA|nr:FHA domain containing protein [Nitzschia inconspicua]